MEFRKRALRIFAKIGWPADVLKLKKQLEDTEKNKRNMSSMVGRKRTLKPTMKQWLKKRI